MYFITVSNTAELHKCLQTSEGAESCLQQPKMFTVAVRAILFLKLQQLNLTKSSYIDLSYIKKVY